MAILQQYQPFAQEFQNVQARLVAILSETDPSFTGALKAKKLAHAHRYFSKVMTALEIFCRNEDSSYTDEDADIDTPILEDYVNTRP